MDSSDMQLLKENIQVADVSVLTVDGKLRLIVQSKLGGSALSRKGSRKPAIGSSQIS